LQEALKDEYTTSGPTNKEVDRTECQGSAQYKKKSDKQQSTPAVKNLSLTRRVPAGLHCVSLATMESEGKT